MHQFLYPHHALVTLEREACIAINARGGVSPYTMVQAQDVYGHQTLAPLWQIEADQTVTLIERLRMLGVTNR